VLFELYHQTKADEYQQEAFKTAEQARSRIFTEMMEDSRAVREGVLKTYSRYADLKKPKSLSLKDVQMLLGPDEAALSYFVGASRTCVWGVTRETARIVLIPIGRASLARQVEDYIRAFPGIAQVLTTLDPVSGTRGLRKALDGYSPEEAHALYQ
jgi:hypothetical protein